MSYTRFRNIQDDGNWKQGGIYTFEFLEYLSPPANGESYVEDEEIERKSLLANDGIFGENNMTIGSKIGFASGYSVSITVTYENEEYKWLDDATDYFEIVDIELVEEADEGDWYRATVKVSESIPVGNYEIISVYLKGVTVSEAEKYEIISCAGGYILYIDGNHTGEEFGALGSLDIINSTGNDGSYTYHEVSYDAETDRTQIGLESFLPVETCDGYVTNVVPGEAPG